MKIKMKIKQLIGIGAIVLGIVLVSFSVHAKNKVHHAKEGMNEVSGFFPKNEVGSAVEHKMHSKLSRYDMMIRWSMIGGVVLIAAGIYATLRFRKN